MNRQQWQMKRDNLLAHAAVASAVLSASGGPAEAIAARRRPLSVTNQRSTNERQSQRRRIECPIV